MIDIFYSTISGEEHERLDKLDAERRAHMERLTQDAEQCLPNGKYLLNVETGLISGPLKLGHKYRIDEDGRITPDNPGSAVPSRPWRPEQQAADIFGHFDTSGKAVTDE